MMEPPHSGSDRVAELLGQEPELDEVTRARMEKNLLAAVAKGRHLEIAETPFAVETAEDPSVDGEDVAGPRRPWGVIGVSAVAAAAAAALFWGSPPDDGGGSGEHDRATFLRHQAGETIDRGGLEAGAELETDDGERVEVRVAYARVDVTPGSKVRFDRVDATRVEVYLLRGAVDVELHPARLGDQTLRVSTDTAHVDVVGTVFRVAVDDGGGTQVSTIEGAVRLTPRAGGPPRLVEAGETDFVAPELGAAPGLAEPQPAGDLDVLGEASASSGSVSVIDDDPAVTGAEELLALVPRVEPVGAAPSVPERLRRAEAALDRGDHRGARRILEAVASTASRPDQRVRAHTLIAESHAAQRNFRAAAEAYGRAVDAGGQSMGAQNALFAMGRLYERQMHDRAAATAAYRDYLQLAPEGAHAGRVGRALCGLGEAEHCR